MPRDLACTLAQAHGATRVSTRELAQTESETCRESPLKRALIIAARYPSGCESARRGRNKVACAGQPHHPDTTTVHDGNHI